MRDIICMRVSPATPWEILNLSKTASRLSIKRIRPVVNHRPIFSRVNSSRNIFYPALSRSWSALRQQPARLLLFLLRSDEKTPRPPMPAELHAENANEGNLHNINATLYTKARTMPFFVRAL